MSNNNTITYYVNDKENVIDFEQPPSYLDDLFQDITGYYKDQDGNIMRYKDDLIK